MKKYIKDLFSKRMSARDVGYRSVLLLIVLACALGAPFQAEAWYSNLGNDRVLLANNDKRTVQLGQISNQGYYDTNSTAGVTFWTHAPAWDNTNPLTQYYLHGTEHILHAADGSPLWHLRDCRTGYVAQGQTTRNYIPISKNALVSAPLQYGIATTNSRGRVTWTQISYTNEVTAGVYMRNGDTAEIYSPYYGDGIGTIYFDVVNSYTNVTDAAIEVQIATNLTEEAKLIGDVAFEDVDKQVDFSRWNDYYDWQNLPITVLHIKGALTEQLPESVTNLVLDVTSGGNSNYYRVRTLLNYYGPIRFRIKRTKGTGETGDTTGLILVDNIIASYPPMTIKFHRGGTDIDEKLTGTSVIGCVGDFDSPFITFRQDSVKGAISYEWITNYADTAHTITVQQPKLAYRWRYLNQKVNAWKEIDMAYYTPEDKKYSMISSATMPEATNLVTTTNLVLGDGVGDLEYYYYAKVFAPYYKQVDYANDTGSYFGKKPGGGDWSEEISVVTNRLVMPTGLTTAALGQDFFTRVREGDSDYKWVALCTSLTTNGTTGVVKEDIRMELVGDHTWRTHYYVPTNHIGETFSFHFQGEQIFTNAWVSGYHHQTNTWYCDLAQVPYVPYTSAAGLGYFHDISCVLDGVGTHLLIEFNDELLSFSISHATYQNFNAWTDATAGYVGHTNWNGEGAVGVSDAKQKYSLEMSEDKGWKTTSFEKDAYWFEGFDTLDFKTYPFNQRFDEHATPNGWTAGHGMFIRGQRGEDVMQLQIEGRGQGWIAMDSFQDDIMPQGIDQVTCMARVAQEPRFEDFAWYMDAVGETQYGFSAVVSMGHEGSKNKDFNPPDVSQGAPSVSLVGYYRPSVGCYEFRITRSGQYQLCASIYKWTPGPLGMTSTLLSSNAVSLTTETIYAKPDSHNKQVLDFGNYLVPSGTTADGSKSLGSRAYILIRKLGSGVRIEGWLQKGSARECKPLNSTSDMTLLVQCDDASNPLKKGTYGVGSTDCAATFYNLSRHPILAEGTINTSGEYIDEIAGYDYEDWVGFDNRWKKPKTTKAGSSTANFEAVVPSSQTLKLEFRKPNSSDGWQPSGQELVVNSYATNKFTFTTRVSSPYQVRLRTGGNSWDDLRTDIVVDDIRVTSWQAPNYDELYLNNGQSKEWVFTQGMVINNGGDLNIQFKPSRAVATKAQGLRSPYLANGLSMVSFDYVNAKPTTKLVLQVYTNDYMTVGSVTESLTLYPQDQSWTTVKTWDFATDGLSTSSGTLTHYMSYRAPIRGLIRLIVDKSVIEKSIADEGKATRDVDYGQITIKSAYCYDEPALDMRSWYAWNFHTSGWNTTDKRFAYLFDSPDGLSGSLNFSAVDLDNTKPDAYGIGLVDRLDIAAYSANNSFVQCPPMTNGIGSVSFRARTFETNATHATAWVTLYGSFDPDDDQLVSPQSWTRIKDFAVSNTTYQTFEWKTTDDSSQYHAIRLEVAGSHLGRTATLPVGKEHDWDRPVEKPLQRVFLDEISVGEPIQPRIVFRNVRPFRTGVVDIPPCVVSNVTDLSEQPLYGESWGLQCTIEPQQMGDDLDEDSIVVYAAFKRGIYPWGYVNWSNEVTAVKLDHIPGTLTFRSSYNVPESIISPVDTPTSLYPDNLWQYYVWCEFKDKSGVHHRHALDSVDWTVPSWYVGIEDLNQAYRSQGFAGYTILDTISPKRAWINEINICDTADLSNSDGRNQFIEIAVPRGADLTGWSLRLTGSSLKQGTIATYGIGNARPASKTGRQQGIDWTNDYTVVALRSPEAAEAGQVSGADGTWDNILDGATFQLSGKSSLYYYESYGLELVRPSGVIEHRLVFQGKNPYEGAWEIFGSGTNLLAKIVAADGPNSQWFFAGSDASPKTLGVFKSHGEDETCWTNMLQSTAGELNKFEDGTRQLIDKEWFLTPNGDYAWIYATVLGDHIHQTIGSKTNNSEVFIIKRGTSTNIVYTVDNWWAMGDVTTNGVKVAEAEGRGDRADNHTWTLDLKDVNETVKIYADQKAGTDVTGLGMTEADPYFPAVMDWLSTKNDENGLYLAKFVPLHGNMAYAHDLGLKEMYWLDIDPTEPDWVLRAGMGGKGSSSSNPVQPIYLEDYGRTYTNSRVVVTMMITNTTTHVVRAPDHLLGLEPGSNSYDYSYDSPAWTSVTFKVCGALQRTDVTNVSSNYYPLRWFVFTKDSFDENFQATIDLWDPRTQSSPGWYYGWGDYPGVPIWYRWRLDGDPAWYDTAEPLKAKSTYSE